ncbi:MAG: HEAT repeat domain-containing protein [Planctomycetota bacterium]
MVLRYCFILASTVAVLLTGTAVAGLWRASSEAQCAIALEQPVGVGRDVHRHLENLSAPDWVTREQASLWLVAERHLWANRLPQGWQPQDAEGRWRWGWVRGMVRTLEDLPFQLSEPGLSSALLRARTLQEELGEVFLVALRKTISHPNSRVRQRAIEILAKLPGVELRECLQEVTEDTSPWVRRTLYSVLAQRDPAWLQKILDIALTERSHGALLSEVVRAVRKTGSKRYTPRLRELWPRADYRTRREIALFLAAYGGPDDERVLYWMLESADYRLTMTALGVLAQGSKPPELSRLIPLLESPYSPARKEVRLLMARYGEASLSLVLLPLLSSEDEELVLFVAERLFAWDASDYFGDIELAQARFPASSALSVVVARLGLARPVPAPAREDAVGIVPALRD